MKENKGKSDIGAKLNLQLISGIAINAATGFDMKGTIRQFEDIYVCVLQLGNSHTANKLDFHFDDPECLRAFCDKHNIELVEIQ